MKRFIFVCVVLLFLTGCSFNHGQVDEIKMMDLKNMSLSDVKDYAKKNNLILKVDKQYSNSIEIDRVISQNITVGTKVKAKETLVVVISLGAISTDTYKENQVNELGNVPIMMYHGIVDMKRGENSYTGGNVDKNGYTRTTWAFIDDLEMYYQKGYRMIRLKDYIDGNINVTLGKSPIVLTFDDGNRNNINILGTNEKGELIIDPKSAVGILEQFKQKYPDFNVTATFFVNSSLFSQPKYDKQILKWLVDHGYDIGNHTKDHADFKSISINETQAEVAYIYQLLDSIIPNKYVNIVALPYGSPGKKSHPNFSYILNGSYEGYSYKTESTLQVGWEPNYSPFHKSFDKTFVKRVRAWDNNGKDFDITMVFDSLSKKRYISDGDPNTIVVPDNTNLNTNITNKKIILY